MLDTDTISDIVKNPLGQAAQRAARYENDVCTSVITVAEIRYGCVRKGWVALLRRVDEVLDSIDVLAFDVPADQLYGRIRHELEAKGQPIGGNDVLIAAHALSKGLIVVTRNVAEYSRVAGLSVENWIGRPS
jgi:tRNA(fMet)-specific endonuclease VapC